MKKYQQRLLVKEVTKPSAKHVLVKLALEEPLPEINAGQFVEILVENSSSTFLRRPISVNYVDEVLKELWLLIAVVGDGTRTLATLKAGDTLDIVFPLGNGFTIENKYLRVTFDKTTGFITSLLNKETGYDYASAEKPIAVPTVIHDEDTDTWAHNVFTFHNIEGVMALEKIELVENGNARCVIRTKHTYKNSFLTQDFILGAEQKTLRVKCKAIWQEKFTLLKMSFPV